MCTGCAEGAGGVECAQCAEGAEGVQRGQGVRRGVPGVQGYAEQRVQSVRRGCRGVQRVCRVLCVVYRGWCMVGVRCIVFSVRCV